MSSSPSLGELGQAYIALKTQKEQVKAEMQMAKQVVAHEAESAASEGDGGGAMSKFMWGRRGPGGFQDSVEHAFGHAALGRNFRMFSMFGGAGLAIGMVAHTVVDLTKDWLSNAEAIERATKQLEEYKKATDAAAKASMDAASATATANRALFEMPGGRTDSQRLQEMLHPKSAESKALDTIKDREEAIKKEGEAQSAASRMPTKVSDKEREEIEEQHGLGHHWYSPSQSRILTGIASLGGDQETTGTMPGKGRC
jgi:hypothetical protein